MTLTVNNCNNPLRTMNSGNIGTTRQSRRRLGVMATATVLVACCCAGANAFSPPSHRLMTMKVDLGGRITTTAKAPQIGRGRGIPSGSPLDMIVKDQNEFELQVGHAMDVLRSDYPEILTTCPDLSIYDPDLELIDPSGVKLHGVKNYKASFRLLHAVVGIFYCSERSCLTFRMCFDKARQNIRIHWNAQVIPKAIFGGYRTTLHADGISVYEISRNSGNITQHRIERLVINDAPVTPENGIFAALRGYAAKSDVDSIPIFNMDVAAQNSNENNVVMRFQNFAPSSRSVLFSSSSSSSAGNDEQQQVSFSQLSAMESNFDGDALEKKNSARKKFGLAPLTPEEYSDLQDQVAELDSQVQKRAAASAAEMARKKKEEEVGFFKKLMGNVMEDTCQSNYDCERPEVCCDFGFKKMCCSSGMRIWDGPPRSRQGQLVEIPVIISPDPYPPTDPRGNRNSPY